MADGEKTLKKECKRKVQIAYFVIKTVFELKNKLRLWYPWVCIKWPMLININDRQKWITCPGNNFKPFINQFWGYG